MNKLWDMAGINSLEVAQSLFGEEITYLAPFQSAEVTLDGEACSVLRLCDRNFRIRYSGPLDQSVLSLQRCVWIKQYDWLGSLVLPIEQLSIIIKSVTVRAPYRLANLPNHQALPARFKDTPILIWRHNIKGKPVVELHVAQTDINRLREQLSDHALYTRVPPTTEGSHEWGSHLNLF